MVPTSPVIPGGTEPEVMYADGQEEYLPLRAVVRGEGEVVTRWKLSWGERFRVFFGGTLWLSVLTFDGPLQPVRLDAKCPTKNGE
jgi:hypothetical protein